MTNEEILQQGGDDMLLRLWENNQGFLRQQAYRWSQSGHVEFEDLMQCGFLVIADAAKNYDPAAGAYITALSVYVKKHFGDWCAAASGWTKSQWERATESGVRVDSLNREIEPGNTNSDELTDFIPDPSDPYSGIIDQMENAALHNTLEGMLTRLESTEKHVIQLLFYKGIPLSEVSRQLNIPYSECRTILGRAFRRLRRMAIRERLEDYIDLHTRFHTHVGAERFQSTWTSAVELDVIQRDKLRKTLLPGVNE